MFDYISQGPPTAQVPGGQSYALAADVVNGALYVGCGSNSSVWKPAGSGLLANLTLTGQTSSSLAKTLSAVPLAGMYSLDWYVKLTTTGTSPTLGPLVITFDDATDGTAQSVTCLGQKDTGVAATSYAMTTTAEILSGSLEFSAGAAAA